MNENWKREAEKLLFAYGKAVLGQSAGGLITQLKNARGIEGAYLAIRKCEGRENPREFLGAVMKEANAAIDGVEIGESVCGWIWDGSKWKEPNERQATD